MASIAAFVDDEDARMRVLLIEGEAGIGKTTLWEEAVGLAESRGAVLSSRPSQSETRLSFSVLGDLLTPVVAGSIDGLPPGQRAALEAALLLGPSTPSRPDARAVSLAVLGVLRSLASARRLTVAIDDAQWIDAPSARALSFAFRRLADEPILLLLNQRLATDAKDPLEVAGISSRVERLTLGPIASSPLGRLLRTRLGQHVAPPDVMKIYQASGGNPFFAIEIGRALQRRQVRPTPGEPLPVPRELDALVRERLSTLSEPSRYALLVAASSASPTLTLVAVAGGEASGIDEAEGAGIVTVRGSEITFTHPLLAASAYGSTPSAVRREVHARLARVATDPEERARHFALSIDGPDEDAALASEHAARRAEERGAPSAAAELFQLAASLTPPALEQELRRRNHGAVGNLWASGDVVSARDLNERLLQELEPGPERAYTMYLAAECSWNDLLRVQDLLTRALDEVGDDRATRAWLLIDLAWAAIWACDLQTALLLLESASEVMEARHDGDALDESRQRRSALSGEALVHALLGEDAEPQLQRGIALEGHRDYNELTTPRLILGQLHLWRGALDSARAALNDELLQRVGEGHETATWEVRALLADVEYRAGRWTMAAQHAREAVDVLLEAGWTSMLGQVLPIKATISCALGDIDSAREDGTGALSQCELQGDRWDEIGARSALGFVELSLGDHAACHAWLGPLVERTEAMGIREPGAFPFVPDEVEALIGLGELDGAERLTARLEEQGRALDRTLALATAARCRGLIDASLGDLDAAVDHLKRALEAHVHVPQPFELARTLQVKGEVERRKKMKAKARETLGRALGLFEELGAPLWAARARAELARIGGRAASPRELTPTERRVAELAGAGHTNREIAGILFISVKTVEANLSRVYQKLGIRSRRGLAATLGPSEESAPRG